MTTKQPIVTVLIVNWNGKDVTLDCLASLQQVTYPAMRILLVDNGSHDDTLPVVRAQYPGVSILALGENKRFAGGNNRGMQVALDEGSDFVLLLNNDTTVAPDFHHASGRPIQGDRTVRHGRSRRSITTHRPIPSGSPAGTSPSGPAR